jgi:hypothetical protein
MLRGALRKSRWFLGLFVLIGLPTWAQAEEPGVSEKIGHGEVNWAERTIVATGSGAPNLKAENAAVARLGAERAAKMDALRNILETVKGIRVATGKTVGQEMAENEVIKSAVEGICKNFKVVDTKYYSDGGVDVVVKMMLTGPLAKAVLPTTTKREVRVEGEKKYSGLIVDARGLGARPAVAPRILDEQGNEIYGLSVVPDDKAAEQGIALYAKDVDSAKTNAAAGSTPLVVKAKALAQGSSGDLVLAQTESALLSNPAISLEFLKFAKVQIVVE